MECGRWGEEPPAPLLLAWWCGESRLPDAGGVLDQDWQTWRQMTAARNVYNVVSRITNLQGEQIHTLNKSERRLWRYLIDNDYW